MGIIHGKVQEEVFNYKLRDALKNSTAQWQGAPEHAFLAERTGTLKDAGKKVDILVQVEGLPIVAIESSYDRNDADKDAMARLAQETARGELIKTAVAVEIPEEFRNFDRGDTGAALMRCRHLGYMMYQYLPKANDIRRLPEHGFFEGSVFNLSHLINSAVVAKEVLDDEADKVADLVRHAAHRLEDALSMEQQRELAGVVYQRTPFKGLQTTAVLWLNALLTMQRLQKQNVPEVPRLPYIVKDAMVDPRPMLDAWVKIWRKNWRSIFGPAITALRRAMTYGFHATADALGLLLNAVQNIELMQLGQNVHIGAELFPKLSEDRKETAAFYTQASTAELLATLTIRPQDLPHKGADLFDTFRVGDLACGTGTLLRAAYQQIKAIHEWSGGDAQSVAQLHKAAMEKGIIGVDISPIAIHFAAASLAAIGTGEPYGKTQVGWVEVGNGGMTGALEYLVANSLGDLFVQRFGRSEGGVENDGSEAMHSVVVPDGGMNVLIMNPPYSRTRSGQTAFDISGLSREEIDACQKRWGKQIYNLPAIKTAGMAASFVAITPRKVPPGGRIGFVLPLTAAGAESWRVTRQMLEHEFEDITAVVVSAGQAQGRDALSADTHMEEMLLTATRRRKRGGKPSPVACVTLQYPPTRLGDAREIGRAILSATKGNRPQRIHLGNRYVGHVVPFRETGEGDAWSHLGVVHPDLAIISHRLSGGTFYPIGKHGITLPVKMATINDVFQVGPTHDLLGHPRGGDGRGAFEFSPTHSESDAIGKDCSLWTADSKSKKQLLVHATHRGRVVRDELAERMRLTASTLFYARFMSWASQSLLSATTPASTMGGAHWTSLGHVDGRVLKAAALWFNSNFGMMVHWTHGQRGQTGRSRTQIRAIKAMPCPRFADLPDKVLDFAVQQFDALKDATLRPACQAHCDPVRKKIDAVVMQMFNMPTDTQDDLAIIRRLWCEEPSVHGNNGRARQLLAQK